MALINAPNVQILFLTKLSPAPDADTPSAKAPHRRRLRLVDHFKSPGSTTGYLTILAPLKSSLASAGDLLPSTLNAPGYHLTGSPVLPAAIGYFETYDEAYSALSEYHKNPYDTSNTHITFREMFEIYQKSKEYELLKKKASHQSYRHTGIVNAFMTWKSET